MYVLRNAEGTLFRKQKMGINLFAGYLTLEAAKNAKAQADTQWNGPFRIYKIVGAELVVEDDHISDF